MPSAPSHLYVVLPAFNEEKALRILIPDLLAELKSIGTPFTICVADDGSSDGTAAYMHSLASDAQILHLRHPKNLGYGAAIRTGITWVIQNGRPEDIVITLDADNTHSPSYLAALIQKIQSGFDAVTASYTAEGGAARGVPVQRQLLSQAANGLLRLRFQFPDVKTYTNGYRAYRVAALQAADARYPNTLIKEANFSGGTELFIKVVKSGGRAGEIPFILDYAKRGMDSKINIPRTILCYLRLLLP